MLSGSSSLSSGRMRSPSLILKNSLVVTQGFMILKPAVAIVMSRFSGKWESPSTLYIRYSSFLVASAYLPCASLRDAPGCVGMIAEAITCCWDPSFLGRWVVMK